LFLIIAMLSLLVAFFALFVALVRFAEHVIRPHRETASPSVRSSPKRTVRQGATP